MRRRPHLPKTSEGASRAAIVGAVLLVFAVMLWLIGYVLTLADDLDDATDALSVANGRLIEAGEKPVTAGAQGEQGIPGEVGQQGRAPTTAEILGAVTAYCIDNTCRGPAGRNVTPAQVAAAVSAYCNDRGECRGPRGDNGRDGEDGTTGRQGPPPTAAQVAAAVASFCADGRCRGAVGPPGPAGPPGPSGSAGAQGPPGPTCPGGFTAEQRTVITDNGPERAMVCVAA